MWDTSYNISLLKHVKEIRALLIVSFNKNHEFNFIRHGLEMTTMKFHHTIVGTDLSDLKIWNLIQIWTENALIWGVIV